MKETIPDMVIKTVKHTGATLFIRPRNYYGFEAYLSLECNQGTDTYKPCITMKMLNDAQDSIIETAIVMNKNDVEKLIEELSKIAEKLED